MSNFTTAKRPAIGQATFLPDPERRPRKLPIISVDDHLIEPPDMFEGRLRGRFADRAPRVVELEDGTQVWEYDGKIMPNIGLNAVAGRPLEECTFDPARFDELRPGTWDVHARIKDMDLDGVYASLNFPSALPGFAGQRLQLGLTDADLALPVVQAWNDWHADSWAGQYPDRIIPCQIPYLLDAEVGAREIERNAARGFHAVSFSEAPEKLGLPSLHTGSWDPFLRACAETETVVCIHIGSSSTAPATAPDAPPDTIGVLFFAYAMFAAVDWLYSRVAVKFPDLSICLSEGGVGWVPGLLDRLDHVERYQQIYGTWDGIDLSPAEVLRRNFWFCALDDPSVMPLRDRIGIDHLLLECDYPHLDSSWPDTQDSLARQTEGFSPDEVRQVAWANASTLFHHPVPQSVQDDPESF
jgi:predicted TIM-barrel fold metal-dependent hydrolase